MRIRQPDSSVNYTVVSKDFAPKLPLGGSQMLEFAKLLASFLGGCLATILAEWFRRRRNRVQNVLLIERVNRIVSPELEGLTLARTVGVPPNHRLEEVKDLREY
jgi:hypothetical protein